jgi:heme-degrading monooxygenase HmoA
MFSVIYSFQVKPGCEQDFIDSWAELTELIYQYEGSLGSRLHKKGDLHYIAYAQWPDKETWQKAGGKLPQSSISVRDEMKNSCEEIETLREWEVVKDILKQTPIND